jgi:hypothetical protein
MDVIKTEFLDYENIIRNTMMPGKYPFSDENYQRASLMRDPLSPEELRNLEFRRKIDANNVAEVEKMIDTGGNTSLIYTLYWAVLYSKPDIVKLCLDKGPPAEKLWTTILNIAQDEISCGLANKENRLICRDLVRNYLKKSP